MYAIKEERTKQTDSRIRNQKSEKTRDNHINFPKTTQRKESSISPKEYFNQRIENSLGKHYNIVYTQEKNREYLAKGLIQKQRMETCQNKSMTFTNPKRLSLLSGVDFSLGASHVVQRSILASGGFKGGYGTFTNRMAREWYLKQEAKIPNLIDKKLPIEQQARQAFGLRNQYRTEARGLMSDRVLADYLEKNEPNITWDEIIGKQISKGFVGGAIYQGIINSSQTSRKVVNEALGFE